VCVHVCVQPEVLTLILEVSNMVFTSVFSLEMLLKLLALGPCGYLTNPYNTFDSVVVIIRYHRHHLHDRMASVCILTVASVMASVCILTYMCVD